MKKLLSAGKLLQPLDSQMALCETRLIPSDWSVKLQESIFPVRAISSVLETVRKASGEVILFKNSSIH